MVTGVTTSCIGAAAGGGARLRRDSKGERDGEGHQELTTVRRPAAIDEGGRCPPAAAGLGDGGGRGSQSWGRRRSWQSRRSTAGLDLGPDICQLSAPDYPPCSTDFLHTAIQISCRLQYRFPLFHFLLLLSTLTPSYGSNIDHGHSLKHNILDTGASHTTLIGCDWK